MQTILKNTHLIVNLRRIPAAASIFPLPNLTRI